MNCECPKVSVIIPVYNSEKFLTPCIDSVIRQNYKNLEIIIVNDGSTDDSQAIIEKYVSLDSRIIPVQKQNEGVSLARKEGLCYATGEYVQFLDSDDTLADGIISLLVDKAEKECADIVVSPFVYCFPNKKDPSLLYSFTQLNGVDYFAEALEGRAYWALWVHFMRRSLFDENVDFMPHCNFGEDAVLMIQLVMKARKIVTQQAVSVYYTVRSSSLSDTSKMSDEKYQDFLDYSAYLIRFAKEKGIYSRLRKGFAHQHINFTFLEVTWGRPDRLKANLIEVMMWLREYPDLKKKMNKYRKRALWLYKLFPLLACQYIINHARKGKI